MRDRRAVRATRVRWAWRLTAVLLAAGHTWAAIAAEAMSEDGIAYLDMGDAILRGDWAMAINAVWSPLYPAVLGTILHVLRPGPEWEFLTAHLVNFCLFLLALFCFEYYWDSLGVSPRRANGIVNTESVLPPWAWISIGYSLFLWSSLDLIRIWAVTPDMLLAALVYFAAGLTMRLGTSERRRDLGATAGLLGLALGLGFLCKAVLFPLAAVLFTALFVATRRDRRLRRSLVAAVVVFLLLAIPWIALISASEGTPTFGEAGRLTYLRYVNNVPYPFWEPGSTDLSQPVHAPRLISEHPKAYEFAEPVGGTYPLSYDPAYWYRGVEPRFDLPQQAGVLLSSGLFYLELFGGQLGGFAAVLLLLLLLKVPTAPGGPGVRLSRALVVTGLAALGLYGMVYVEGRYIAPFVLLVLGGMLHEARLPPGDNYRKTMATAGGVMVFFVLLSIGKFNIEGLLKVTGRDADVPAFAESAPANSGSASGQAKAALALRELGVRPEEQIAFVGYAFGAYFARLARVRITRQVPEAAAAEFWNADEQRVLALLQDLLNGTRAVVTDWTPTGPSAGEWRRLGDSPYHVYLEPTPASNPTASPYLRDGSQ